MSVPRERGRKPAARVNVVRFVLGEFSAALPARAVQSLTAADAELSPQEAAALQQTPHLSDILGYQRIGDADEERLLTVVGSDGQTVQLMVDGPVSFRTLLPDHLLRLPAWLGPELAGPVAAITERGGNLGYVLDPVRVVALLVSLGHPNFGAAPGQGDGAGE